MSTSRKIELTPVQLDDLAELFSRTLAPGNLSWLANAVLELDLLRQDGNNLTTPELSKQLVKLLHEREAIAAGVTLLQRESQHPSSSTWCGSRPVCCPPQADTCTVRVS